MRSTKPIKDNRLSQIKMAKYLITGVTGFVARHYIQYLQQKDSATIIAGIYRTNTKPGFEHNGLHLYKSDLSDLDEIQSILHEFEPDYIVHLAAQSSVALSWQQPVTSFMNNMNIYLNLIEALRLSGLKSRLLSVGSSEEYGNVAEADIPLREELYPDPVSPYAVARVSQELISKVYVNGYNLDIVSTRSFNHFGPGQREVFVISSFARQLINIKEGRSENSTLKTGNLKIVRDFLDVRDVVVAYDLILHDGQCGEVYNVCSGNGVRLEDILLMMAKSLGIEITYETDPDLIRPNDNQVIIGDNTKIKAQTQWQQKYTIEQSIHDILEDWYYRLKDVK